MALCNFWQWNLVSKIFRKVFELGPWYLIYREGVGVDYLISFWANIVEFWELWPFATFDIETVSKTMWALVFGMLGEDTWLTFGQIL